MVSRRSVGRLAGLALASTASGTLIAQAPPSPDDKPARAISMPTQMPAPTPFAKMTPVQAGTNNNQRYAVDVQSLRFDQRSVVMVAIGVRSSSGATTTGYYAFNCEAQSYRLLAYPSGQQWKASSRRTKWRDVFSVTRRPPPFPTVYTAACLPGGVSVGNQKQFGERLVEGRQLSPG